MAQKLKFGNGTWATKKGSTLSYNDEGGNFKPLPFATTRNSIGTRVNKEGLIEVVGNDVPRIDYTDSADGVLLLEPQRTNLEDKSNGFSTWSSSSNITRTADYVTSPDGTQNATRLQFTANGFCSNKTQSLGTYTMSCYAKRNDSGTQDVGFFRNGSGVVNSSWEITSEWKRFSYAFPALNAGAMGIAGNSGADISVYGFQLEGLVSYPTSYIPTQGSSVTRQADTANGAGNSEVFNDSEGVLFANIAAFKGANTDRQISISDGSNSNKVGFQLMANGTQFQFYSESSGSGQVNIFKTINATDGVKIGFSYKVNDFKVYVNGFLIVTDTSGAVPIGLKELAFDRGTGGDVFYGKTKELGYYDTALTDEELEYLTSYRTLNELVTELNLNKL